MNPHSKTEKAALLLVISSLAETLFPSVKQNPNDPCQGATTAEFWKQAGNWSKHRMWKVLSLINTYLPAATKRRFILFLTLLTWRFGTLLFTGRRCLSWSFPFVRKFTELDLQTRAQILYGWSTSSVETFRQAFKGIKSIILAVLLGEPDEDGSNPLWLALEYQPGGPATAISASPDALAAEKQLASAVMHLSDMVHQTSHTLVEALKVLGLAAHVPTSSDEQLLGRCKVAVVIDVDCVVVGSGAGGGVAAARCAQAGLRVLVLEKSTWMRMSDMSQREADAMPTMYELSGLMASEDGAVNVVAGSTLGGGTKINWAAAIRTPEVVRKEWATQFGLEDLAGPKFEEALDAVHERLGVGMGTVHNGPNSALARGLQSLQADCMEYPRNCSNKVCSSYCCLGCKWGHKKSTDITFLVDAVAQGARVLTGAIAERVACRQVCQPKDGRNKEAVGVLVAPAATPNGPAAEAAPRVFVRAPLVISSAGSLHTPALLLRSGISCRGNVGKNLRLHPSLVVVAQFPEPTHIHQGAMMSVVSRQAANWSGSGYGALVSVAVAHPSFCTASWPWAGGEQLKHDLLRMNNSALFVVIARDKDGGCVSADPVTGHPVVRYWPSAHDQQSMLNGLALAIRAAAAAGADTIIPIMGGGIRHTVRPGPGAGEELEEFISKVRAVGVQKYTTGVFSAHQMGSCRVGTSPDSSACDPSGQCWEAAGLYVCDASAMPSCSGANPMLTTEALSYLLAGEAGSKYAGMLGRQAAAQVQFKARDGRRAIEVVYDEN